MKVDTDRKEHRSRRSANAGRIIYKHKIMHFMLGLDRVQITGFVIYCFFLLKNEILMTCLFLIHHKVYEKIQRKTASQPHPIKQTTKGARVSP